jgi:hypothetical protein
MDVVRIIWIVNFFFFLLVLIFLWSKMYLVMRKINELIAIIKSCDEIPETRLESKKGAIET